MNNNSYYAALEIYGATNLFDPREVNDNFHKILELLRIEVENGEKLNKIGQFDFEKIKESISKRNKSLEINDLQG